MGLRGAGDGTWGYRMLPQLSEPLLAPQNRPGIEPEHDWVQLPDETMFSLNPI